MFSVVIGIWSVGGLVVYTERVGRACGVLWGSDPITGQMVVRTVCWSGSSKATVSNMIDYLPIGQP